jgi:sugar lactone lactonase YvrE
MKFTLVTLLAAWAILALFSCAPNVAGPNTSSNNTNAATTNLVSSTTNNNIVTNVNAVVTSSNISNYYYARSWGGPGTGDGQFAGATEDLSFDLNYQIYAPDQVNCRVQVFDTNGTFLRKWGSSGTGNGQFSSVNGLAVSLDGKVYVADENRVQVFSTNGVYINKWGSSGTGNGQFNITYGPNKILIDPFTNIWVTDPGNSRIQKFDTNGTYLAQYPISGNGLFLAETNFWIADYAGGLLRKYDFSGNLSLTYGPSTYYPGPIDLAICAGAGQIYVADASLNTVVVLSLSGVYLFEFGINGTNTNQVRSPRALLVDPITNIYLVNVDDKRIKVFTWGTQIFYYTNYVTNVTTNL